jgi:hypothetical protein
MELCQSLIHGYMVVKPRARATAAGLLLQQQQQSWGSDENGPAKGCVNQQQQ